MIFNLEEKTQIRYALSNRITKLKERISELERADPRDSNARLHLDDVRRYLADSQTALSKFL